jgi:ankyrin repeat protein
LMLCEMTFWEDELKLHAGSLLPNAKIVDLTDLNTLKTAGDIVAYDRVLPWDCAVECRGRRGVRPLHLAAIAGDSEAVCWLLSAGADCDAKDAKGCTALFRACQHGSSQAAQHLLDAGANYLLQNQSLETPLYIASLCGFFGCVDALLTADSRPGRNQLARFDYFDGWSPLHAACLKGSFEIAQALLDAGFDANALNKWRQAPMHVCARSGNIALAELLYSRSGTSTDGGGAEVAFAATPSAAIDQADVDDLTPVRIAYDRGHHAMVVWLTERGATVPTANEKSKRRGRRRQKKKRGTPARGRGATGHADARVAGEENDQRARAGAARDANGTAQ